MITFGYIVKKRKDYITVFPPSYLCFKDVALTIDEPFLEKYEDYYEWQEAIKPLDLELVGWERFNYTVYFAKFKIRGLFPPKC